MAATSRSKKLGIGCLSVFFLPFAAVGVGGTYWLYHLVAKQQAMRSWAEVPAVIKNVELQRSRGGRKNRTQHVVATYEYEFKGHRYQGDRVGFHGGSDNFGTFHNDAYRELHRHAVQKKPFRAFVDPRNPSDSVLYPRLRWEMLAIFTAFAAVFGSIGLGGLAGVVSYARSDSFSHTMDSPEDKPWLARSDWISGRIAPTGGAAKAVPVLAAIAAFWWFASGPLLSKMPEILPPVTSSLGWLTLAFPGIGVLLLMALVHQFLRKQKFGGSTLELASTPGVVGGQLVGVVRIERIIPAEAGYRLKLSCIERVRKSNDNTAEEVLWQDEQLVTEPMRDAATGSMALPVLFTIPYTAQETSHGTSKRNIDWRLEVLGKMPGVDYKSRFEVPVFKTPESRRDFQFDKKLSTNDKATPPRDLLLREAGIVKERLPGGGVRLTFPALRNLGSAIFIAFFLAIWSGAIWLMLHWEVPILFPIVSGLVGILIVWIVVELWFYRSVVEARVDGVTFRGGLFGIGRKHVWNAKEIKRFTTSKSMSSGTNVWKHVDVLPTAGKKRTIGRTIPGKLATQAVIDELNAALRRTDVV